MMAPIANAVYPVPSGWRLRTAGDIRSPEPNSCVAGPFGSKISSKYFVDDGVPVIRGTNLRDDLTRFVPEGFAFVSEARAQEYRPQHVKGGDLVFTCWGTIGQVGLVPDDGPYPEYIISNKQLKLRVHRDIADPRFCFYYFASPRYVEYIRNRGIGGAVPGINLGILKSLPIALPPIDVQHRIADLLCAYDDLIENNRRRMALLEEAERQLYREWFVRLRFPGHEHARITKGVPEGWQKKTLGELAEITMGQSPESQHYNEDGEGIPFHQGVTDFGERFVTHRIYCTALNRVAEAGDILCSVRAPVGRLNVTLDKIVIGRGLAALRSRTGHQSLLLQQLRAHFFKEDLIGGGAIFASVTKKEFSTQELLDPSEPLKRAFEELTIPCDDQIRVLHQQSHQLRGARDLLLPRLMNGEITV